MTVVHTQQVGGKEEISDGYCCSANQFHLKGIEGDRKERRSNTERGRRGGGKNNGGEKGKGGGRHNEERKGEERCTEKGE